jgi:hypothetical protein
MFAIMERDMPLIIAIAALFLMGAGAGLYYPTLIQTSMANLPSHLAASAARLERELMKTKERLSKLHVDQSTSDFKLRQHIKESGPGVELRFTTSESTFRVKDLDPQAAASWRAFCHGLLSEQTNAGASLRIVDRGNNINHIVELPVWKSTNAA